MKHHDIQLTGSISITGSLTVPVGTTEQRPTNPKSGSIRMNTTTGVLEIYTAVSGSEWATVGAQRGATPFTATGGEVTTVGAYTVHTFTSSADFEVDIGTTDGEIEYLIVGGGGAGGSGRHAGAGGAGGMLTGTTNITSGTYTFTIGAGGTSLRAAPPSTNGQDTTALGFTAVGGGRGGDHGVTPLNEAAGNGGSGGSAAHTAGLAPGTGTAGQGNDGSRAVPDRTLGPSGGGAGGNGLANGTGNETTSTGAADDGGPGLQSNIDGNNYYYAGGGGGAASPQSPSYLGNWSGGDGGIGGGGGGSCSSNAGSGGAGGGSARNNGAPGVVTQTTNACHGGAGGANTGGGGGGAAGWSSTGNGDGGNGGSGIVIVRYLTA